MTNECAICNEEKKDEVFMTCVSKHSFCFSCLLKSVESFNKLKNCPLCRGGDKFIIVTNFIAIESDDFYSLFNFNKNIKIIQKILNIGSTNTCLISENILLFYIKNKTQLNIFNFLIENNFEENKIGPLIKWNTSNNLGGYSVIAEEFISGLGLENNGNFESIRELFGRF